MKSVANFMLLFIFCFSFSYGQNTDFVIISEYNVLDTIHLDTDIGKEDIVYLGVINGENGEILYHIITVRYIVFATNHSYLVLFYLDLNYQVIRRWELGSDSDVPFSISENKMYFKYIRDNKIEYFIYDVGVTPPKFLCVKPDDCY